MPMRVVWRHEHCRHAPVSQLSHTSFVNFEACITSNKTRPHTTDGRWHAAAHTPDLNALLCRMRELTHVLLRTTAVALSPAVEQVLLGTTR